MWLPPNSTFLNQINLFAYPQHILTHIPVCCQSPVMILMRNTNDRCQENMLILIASQAMLTAMLACVEDVYSVTQPVCVAWLPITVN